MKLTAEQRIQRAHVSLMQSKRFCLFSGVFMVGKVTVDEEINTAYTNGRDVTYGRGFVDSLNDKQLAFLIVHEAMHKAYRHMTVWQALAKEDQHLTNVAMDFVINLEIQDADPYGEDVSMPRDQDGELMGCLDERFRGMDTKQVYDILKKEGKGGKPRKGTGKGKESNGGTTSEGGGNGHDQGQNEESSECLDEHDWDNAREMTQEEKEELSREIDSALREGSILAGKMKGNIPRGIGDLLHPKVDWKEAMREFIKVSTRGGDQSTWRKPNRRYLANGIIMPSAESHKAKTIVIGTDASGSIEGELLNAFLSEVVSVANDVNPECIELLYWDSHVASRETYRDSEVANIIHSTKPKGGGGTQPECVPKFMVDEAIDAQCTVMLTDGYFYGGCGDWSKTNAPVLWCVIGNKDFVPTVGKCVLVE